MKLTTALCGRKGENAFPAPGCSPERKACSVLPEKVLYFTVQYALASRNIHRLGSGAFAPAVSDPGGKKTDAQEPGVLVHF